MYLPKFPNHIEIKLVLHRYNNISNRILQLLVGRQSRDNFVRFFYDNTVISQAVDKHQVYENEFGKHTFEFRYLLIVSLTQLRTYDQ